MKNYNYTSIIKPTLTFSNAIDTIDEEEITELPPTTTTATTTVEYQTQKLWDSSDWNEDNDYWNTQVTISPKSGNKTIFNC